MSPGRWRTRPAAGRSTRVSLNHARISSRVWEGVREDVLQAAGGRCRCGKRATEVHHKVMLKDGGAALDPANLQAVCDDCHREAHARPEGPQARALREWAAGVT